jgi:predicted nucleic acid-binding protein
MRAGKVTPSERHTYFQDVSALFPLALPRSNLVATAFDLGGRHSLSYWDSLLLAACLEAGVDTLYSEDLSAGTAYDGVTVVNPFV